MIEADHANNDRLIRIESALMQLDHDFQQVHQAMLAQQREIDAVRRGLERLEATLERGDRLSSEVRDPEAEKPPHY